MPYYEKNIFRIWCLKSNTSKQKARTFRYGKKLSDEANARRKLAKMVCIIGDSYGGGGTF